MQTVLRVEHNQETRMVGKVFLNQQAHVFYHADTTGTQVHKKLNSPGGIDRCVLEWLGNQFVEQIVHYNGKTKMTYETTLTKVLELGIDEASGGRHRRYLDFQHWAKSAGPPSLPIPSWISQELKLAAQ